MHGLRCLAIVGVVVLGGGVTAVSVVDSAHRPSGRTDPPLESPQEPMASPQEPIKPTESSSEPLDTGERAYWLDEPVVLADVPVSVRGLERSRRARRPANQKRKTSGGLTFDAVLAGRHDADVPPLPKPAAPMPPTSCQSVEPAPKLADTGSWSGPHGVHELTFWEFGNASGFGFFRMSVLKNRRGVWVVSSVIDRVELVSLLTDDEPSVYVLDEMATPALARQAKRRPLDEFEGRALDMVRRGEHLVWTREAPTRMFGAIRALRQCLDCHTSAKRGDLLGAFTYYLDTPVDLLGAKRPGE